ncbi:MAG: polymerase, partial [Cyanobacteria bacterium]|nr:polymerase [Cyanobacteriota bacterium]MDW8202891.1 polymerase [Cyanobacteriota bacterium SKYGB_h_bin112]
MKRGWFSQIVTEHPDPSLQGLWRLIQLGWLLAPVHGVAFGALMIWAMALCVWRKSDQLHRSWLNRTFCILAIWIAGTVVIAADPYVALLGTFNILPFFLLFITVSFVVQTIDQLRHLARLSLIPASIVVILGVGQYFWQWQGPPQPWEGILGWALALGGNPPGRMASVFMYANSMAGYLVMVLPLAIALWLEPMLSNQQQPSTFNRQASVEQAAPPVSDPQDFAPLISHRLPIAQRLLAVSPLPAFARYALPLLVMTILTCIVFTHSRNAWGIAALTCLAYALYWGWYWVLAILVAGIGVVWGAAFAPMPVNGLLRQVVPRFIWARLTDDLYPNRPIAELRITQWKFA